MSPLHKIFFVGAVILSIVAGSHFSGANNASGDGIASVIISASEKEPVAENSQPAETAQTVISNYSTTSSETQVNGQADALSQAQGENSESAMDNGALLKTDTAFALGAFRKVGGESP